MRKNGDNNILEVFFLSWIGVITFLALTTHKWVVVIALAIIAASLILLTLIPRDSDPYINRPRSVKLARCMALLLILIAAWIQFKAV